MSDKTHVASIDAYTDGSLKRTKNGIKCGYGIYFPNKEVKNVSSSFTYGEITNNRAELYAIYRTIKKVIKEYTFDILNIYTDSEYSQKSLTVWINTWKCNGWINSAKKPVVNQDIIKSIDKYLQRYKGKINIQWIRAHTNNNNYHSINNAKADELANKGAEKSIL